MFRPRSPGYAVGLVAVAHLVAACGPPADPARGGSATSALAARPGPGLAWVEPAGAVIRGETTFAVRVTGRAPAGARLRFRLVGPDGRGQVFAAAVPATTPTVVRADVDVEALLRSGALTAGPHVASVELAGGSTSGPAPLELRVARRFTAPRVLYDHDLSHVVDANTFWASAEHPAEDNAARTRWSTDNRVYAPAEGGRSRGRRTPLDVGERIALTVEEVRATSDVDAIVVAAGTGEVPVWHGEYYPPALHAELWADETGRPGPPEGGPLMDWVLAGGDPLGAARAAARRPGARRLGFYVSVRMNDKHFTHLPGHYDPYTGTIRVPSPQLFPLVSHFLWSGGDRRISLERHRGDEDAMDPSLFGSGYHVLMDYSKGAGTLAAGDRTLRGNVAEHKEALVRDLVRIHDMDGLVLDFMRVPHLFNQRETTRAGRVAVMTRLIAGVREALDERGSSGGRPVVLGVRIPYLPEARSRLGIDVRAWALSGVDLFVLGFERDWAQPFYYAGPDGAVRIVNLGEPGRVGGDVLAFQEISYGTQVRRVLATDCTEPAPVTYEVRERCWRSEHGRRCDRIEASVHSGSRPARDVRRRTTREQMLSGAHAAYDRGADGVYLFNMPYYRGGDGPGLEERAIPPFEVMGCLGDRECVSRSPALHYFLSRQFELDYQELDGRFPLPVELPVAPARVAVALHAPSPRGGWPEAVRLDVELESPPGGEVRAWLGGHRLAAVRSGAPDVSSGDRWIDPRCDDAETPCRFRCGVAPEARRRSFRVERAWLRDGRNVIELQLAGGGSTRVERLDLSGRRAAGSAQPGD